MRYQLPDGRTFDHPQAFELHGDSYPANWLELAAQDDLDSRGITTLPDLPPGPAPIWPVSPRQIRQALTRADLRAQVEAAVAAGDQDLKDWYAFSTSFERVNPQVMAMGAALGVSDAQLDDLWRLAATL